MNIQERLNLERENVQLKKELSVLKRKMELLESNRSLNSFSQHLIDKMQAIIFIKDVTNGFRYYRVNDAFCSIQHLSRQEVIGKQIMTCSHLKRQRNIAGTMKRQ